MYFVISGAGTLLPSVCCFLWEVEMRALFMEGHDKADNASRFFRALRLALSGAIVGAAIAGLLSKTVGTPVPVEHVSALGAVGGFIVVAAIKIAHLI